MATERHASEQVSLLSEAEQRVDQALDPEDELERVEQERGDTEEKEAPDADRSMEPHEDKGFTR